MNEIKMRQRGGQNKLIKDLGISKDTFFNWKKEFGFPNDSQIKYSDSEKLKLMGKYYKIKQRNPKIRDSDIVKRLNISSVTLYNWIKQFGPTFNKNSNNEHSLPKKRQPFADNDTSEHPMASSDDNLWAWNLATQKRTERTELEHF
uniref:Transposase n=1 Tax=Globodera rostochiensis TaxID=31243 RepID=A0A914H3G3_GLORO